MTTRTVISDPADPRLDDVRDLNHSDSRPDLPGGKGLVVAEGPLVVGRLLESRYPVRAIVGFKNKLDSFLDSIDASLVEGIPVYEVSRELLAEVAGFDMHRGLLATADRTEEASVAQVLENARTVVVLEGVGDHENIGSMFRNAAGMGVDSILFGNGCADPLYRRVVRVSMGHVLRLPFAHLEGTYTTWQRSLEQLKEAGFHLVSLTPDPEAEHLEDALAGKDKVALLVGAEGPGLTEHAMRATDVRARIPMAPGTDSLNLATSAAIAFYERDRSQR
ncbi:RNA methyltransferase [Corynebacterium glutamicum]|uniref:TrmH family RNA methyltransferase n=1 Tax=Corynebacterium glutamicum TaxID=1718 RepID=UPI00058A582D|nr:RNA methyltransferase [Corynebacterium glutamicum]AJE66851.1 rRNA methyltransferase [Corynebacterium glutamicum]ALP49578.1 rRNA methyltransferase [Corynebacterium glutamicum]ANU33090.1 rRNA methyltransferase [Corynebacterium glutamicum]APT06837.1 rRNA methyltransferase [Corynebacterium glutamicum]OKX93266.1 rRNA methyltransferase [Corynebacterium glutamicum]